MPGWNDLQNTQGVLRLIQAEQVDNRHQMWFYFVGDNNSYYLYLDENKDVALIQADILRTAFSQGLTVRAYWQNTSVGRKTYAVRASS